MSSVSQHCSEIYLMRELQFTIHNNQTTNDVSPPKTLTFIVALEIYGFQTKGGTSAHQLRSFGKNSDAKDALIHALKVEKSEQCLTPLSANSRRQANNSSSKGKRKFQKILFVLVAPPKRKAHCQEKSKNDLIDQPSRTSPPSLQYIKQCTSSLGAKKKAASMERAGEVFPVK